MNKQDLRNIEHNPIEPRKDCDDCDHWNRMSGIDLVEESRDKHALIITKFGVCAAGDSSHYGHILAHYHKPCHQLCKRS